MERVNPVVKACFSNRFVQVSVGPNVRTFLRDA